MKADASLEESLRGLLHGRVLLLGIGNRLRSDDAAGPLLADRLSGRVNAEVIDAGDVPENYIGPIRKLGPEVVLALDAVRSGRRPGQVQLFGRSGSNYRSKCRGIDKNQGGEAGNTVDQSSASPAQITLWVELGTTGF